MVQQGDRIEVEWIDSVINNYPLAVAIHESVTYALRAPLQVDLGAKTMHDVFSRSLKAATYKIQKSDQGKLFQRLLEHGPPGEDDPEILVSDGRTVLSDPECSTCVQFIHYHMINRFKGELAELLALKPCIELVQSLQSKGHLPPDLHLYGGEVVKEHTKPRKAGDKWGPFRSGADGLLVERVIREGRHEDSISIHGVIEVKSFRAKGKILRQLSNHCDRLEGGVRLGPVEYTHDEVRMNKSTLLRVFVIPSSWKLSREWYHTEESEGRRSLIYPDKDGTPGETQIKKIESRLWRITLSWSQEAIEQAAYEMTFWFMGRVGNHIYAEKPKPKDWKYMENDQAGQNSVKMALYYLPHRYLPRRQELIAVKLYNIYCFGYPQAIDHTRRKQMIWSENNRLVGQFVRPRETQWRK